jgi:hypothetical protein
MATSDTTDPTTTLSYASAKIREDDHAAFKSSAEQFDSNIMEVIAASRRLWDDASDRRKLAAIRQVRESGIKVA